jgi:hypothetical protein
MVKFWHLFLYSLSRTQKSQARIGRKMESFSLNVFPPWHWCRMETFLVISTKACCPKDWQWNRKFRRRALRQSSTFFIHPDDEVVCQPCNWKLIALPIDFLASIL